MEPETSKEKIGDRVRNRAVSDSIDDDSPLYNSRIIKMFLEYIEAHYPDVDISLVLEYSGMKDYQVEDSAYWFDQRHVDRFHGVLLKMTGNIEVAREAGRYAVSSKALGPRKQYVLGLLSLTSVYMLIEKLYPLMSRGASVRTEKQGRNRVELTSVPKPGVNEKPYQCANRIGIMESLGKFFTENFARVEHPQCFHRGDECCRYIITWKRPPFTTWNRIRNISYPLSFVVSIISFFMLDTAGWLALTAASVFLSMLFSIYSGYLEKKDLTRTLEAQGEVAQANLEEVGLRYNNALLVQEIGRAMARFLDAEQLVAGVTQIMEKHLDFDKGMILVADREKNRMQYTAGYGFTGEEEDLLRDTEFALEGGGPDGLFTSVFKKLEPVLVNDVSGGHEESADETAGLPGKTGMRSLICAPVVYESKAIGVLAVGNTREKRPLTQTDLNFIMGIASQLAVGITNAESFGKLQESEEKYRTLFQESLEAMSLTRRGKILDVNPAWLNLHGFGSKDEVRGTDILDIIHPDDRELFLYRRPKWPDNLERLYQVRDMRKDGTSFEAEIYSCSIPMGGEYAVLTAIRDMTERNEAEKERHRLEERLRHSEKMEAIGTLAGGVAHDLNNILSGIVSYPELIMMDLPDDSHLIKPIQTIQKSGQRAAAIVQDLLTLARRGLDIKEVVNLNHVVEEYSRSPEFEKLKAANPFLEFEFRPESGLSDIMGSPVHLSKALMNLVANAADACVNRGTVSVVTENRSIGTALGGYEEVREGDYAVLKVMDNGIGISKDDLNKIFEPFYTKKIMGRSGTGLGMSVVWGTVKDHDGCIDIKSFEGRGTTFELLFPVTKEKTGVRENGTPIEKYMGKGELVLVVDDVEDQREIASVMLGKLGYKVKTFSSGEEAADYLRDNHADVILLDMIMDPGMDGLDTYRLIKGIRPEQKAVITSGFSESERVKEAGRLGARQYIRKPYSLEDLGTALRKELDG